MQWTARGVAVLGMTCMKPMRVMRVGLSSLALVACKMPGINQGSAWSGTFWIFPKDSTGKRSRWCSAGWERDGKTGR